MSFKKTNSGRKVMVSEEHAVSYIDQVIRIIDESYDPSNRKNPKPLPERRVIASGDRACVWVVSTEGKDSCVKIFDDDRLFVRIRRMIGLDKAKRAFINGCRLMQLGILVPDMIAYVRGSFRKHPLLLTEFVESLSLEWWLKKKGLWEQEGALFLARYIAKMHALGVVHMDLSPKNLLIRKCEKEWQVFLLDYEDARFFKGPAPKNIQIEALHHLNERLIDLVTLKERLRCLREYLSHGGNVTSKELLAYMKSHPSKYTEGKI